MAQSPHSADGRTQTRNISGQKAIRTQTAVINFSSTSASPGSNSPVETRSRGMRHGVETKFSPRSTNKTNERENWLNSTNTRGVQTVPLKVLPAQSLSNSGHTNGASRNIPTPIRSVGARTNGSNAMRNVVHDLSRPTSTGDKHSESPYKATPKHLRQGRPTSRTRSINGTTHTTRDTTATLTSLASNHADGKEKHQNSSSQSTDKPSISSTSDGGSEFSNSEEDDSVGFKRLVGRKTKFQPSQAQEESSSKHMLRRPLQELGDKPQPKPIEYLQAQLPSGSKSQDIKSPKRSTSAKILSVSNGQNKNADALHTPVARKAASPAVTGSKSSPASDTTIRARMKMNQRKVEYDAAIKAGTTSQTAGTDIDGKFKIPSPGLTPVPQLPLIKDPIKHEFGSSRAKKSNILTHPPRIMTISIKDYEENLRSHLSQLRDDQSYFTKHKIQSARAKISPPNPKFVLAKSPFEGITSIKCEASVKQNIGKFGHFVKGTSEKSNNLTAYSITSYKQGQPSIPPYMTYIPAKRNVLTEDDKQRTFLPYHGDDFEVDDTDKEYAALETKIEENQNRYHRLNKLEDMSRMHSRYAERFLFEIGCDMEAVLQYLLDESDHQAPASLPKDCASFWNLRTSYLQDGYYEEEDDQDVLDRQDTPDQTKPQRQWQQLYDQLSKASDEELAIACVACKVFRDVAGFSLFHVVQKFSPKTETSFNPYSLGTYLELACFICKAHECPGHGEYHDTDQGKNTRERVNFKPGSPDPEALLPYRINDEEITDLLGLQDDGEVTGPPWTTFRSSPSAGFSDSELCHEDCFWAKQARVTELSIWHKDDDEAFRMLRPAYEFERRGPCLMAQCGLIRKSCKEIFLKLLLEPTTHNEYSLKIRNGLEATAITVAPRRTTDQWFEDLKEKNTWRQDQREPFVPCDHAGPCSEATNCSCFWENIHCEKSCACSDRCGRRFQGCRCHAKGRPCRTDKCECRRFNRECDPDLCISCEADEVLDPANRHNEEAIAGKCNNVSIQRGVPKRTLLGPSKLMADGGKSGWGLYMGEECRKGDFIGEYRGEIISEAEADQRGTIYDKRNLSYLFSLNAAQLLDSTLIGNKLRFINHQAEPWANCMAKLLLCNGAVRIGIFALKDIAISEEMFFNYGANFATKFDMIKLNADGSVTVEPAQKGSKPREVFKRRLPEIRNSHYQLKNKISKNGQRLGRPPKDPAKSHPPSLASATSQSTTSHKRFRSEVSDEAEYNGAFSGRGSESELERTRDTRRKRLRRSPSDLNNEISEENIRRYGRSRLRDTRNGISRLSQASTQSPGSSREMSGQPDYNIMTRTKAISQTQQRNLSIPTPSPSRRTVRSTLLQSRHMDDRDSIADEEGVEEDELTPRRSNRRRLGKQHFDDTGSSAGTPPKMKRTARKEPSK